MDESKPALKAVTSICVLARCLAVGVNRSSCVFLISRRTLSGLRFWACTRSTSTVFKGFFNKPNGIFLVTGPTGSGKTTTLYASLTDLNRPDVKIITAEDPVEYNLSGINQSQVNHGIDLTFGRILRAMLRQAPNIILVGEIRDQETAEIAIQAALTGHLVFSTLHTNDASSSLTRLSRYGREALPCCKCCAGDSWLSV